MKHKETPVSFVNSEEKLYGILHQPLNAELKHAPLLIFLHGFAGYRIGPHQLFIKTARFLTQRGYSCLRFDFRGRGYSEGARENTNYKSMVSDLDVVIQSVNQNYKPSRIILLGICSGARTALYYIKNGKQAVHSLIELSSPALWTTNEISAATSKTKAIINSYTKKAGNLDNWKRLIAGEVNRKMITKIISKSITNYGFTLKNSIHVKKKDKSTQKSGEKQFINFKGEVLLIHGEKDPESIPAMKQIKSLLQKNLIQYEDLIIKNANHSFYGLHWEKEIIDSIHNWLMKRFPVNFVE